MPSDDWTLTEGVPGWVWRADERMARLARKHDGLMEIPERIEALRRQYMPGMTPSQFHAWIGPKLEHCRSRRARVMGRMEVVG